MTEPLHTPEKTAIIQAVEEYVRHGCALTPLHPKSKRPFGLGWGENLVRNVADVPTRFAGGKNVGIHLGENNLMSLDIDEPALTRRLFEGLGLDLDAALNAGHRLMGKPGGARTLFRVPHGFPKALLKDMHYTVSATRAKAAGLPVNQVEGDINVLELRGGSFQDVLPPSVHPGGHLYAWHPDGIGPLKNPKDAPEVPASLAQLWYRLGAGRAYFDQALGLMSAANDERMSAGFGDMSVLLEDADKLGDKPKAPLSKKQEEFREVAEAFGELNDHDFGALLVEYGYTAVRLSDGVTKWLRKGSVNAPGVELMRDKKRIISHHGDNLNDGKPKDYFQAWAILKHWDDERGGPNLGAAIREAAKLCGIILASDVDADDDFGSFDDEPAATAPGAPVPRTKGAKPKRKLRFYTPKELAERPPRKWLIDGFIPEGGEVCFYGPPGSGKSFASLDMAMCVALGRPWHGKKVQQGGVIYIAAEGGGGQRQRLNAYEMQHGVALDDAPFYMISQAVNLMDDDDVSAILDVAACTPVKPALIIVDTLARSMAGGDENSTKDMTQAMAGVQEIIATTGACVLLVHHTGKAAEKGARGSSALLGAMDTMLEICRQGDSPQRTITLKKSRDSEDGLKVAFSLMPVVVGKTEDGEDISVPVVVPAAVPAGKRGDAGDSAPQASRLGVWQQRVLRVLDNRSPMPTSLDELVDLVRDDMPPGPARTGARDDIKAAAKALLKRSLIHGDLDSMTLCDPLG